MSTHEIDRRSFFEQTVTTGATLTLAGMATAASGATVAEDARRIKVGVIGCGSVSHSYLPQTFQMPLCGIGEYV